MLRCIIIDDEPFAVELIQSYVEQIPFLQLKATFHDAINASEYIHKNDLDLIFLDIQMPHINGIQLLKSIKQPPSIIFTTAFDQYAVEGFELNAVDYLLKPFSFDRFQKAVNKAHQIYKIKHPDKEDDPFIFVKSDYQMIKIFINAIQFIEGWDDYIKIYVGDKPIMTLMSLKSVLEILPANDFLRVHRSYIVPVKRIESIRNKMIRIAGKEIPVGPTYMDVVNEFINRK
ncbi:MAG TPA: LytTR family DNA-binding domain-containing protein [Bacteroidia bacterium]|nr:LytTR family DNA-binding domain-containing protein [Bacteroidia bacterium]